MGNIEELQQSFVEVRKAYRLLYTYQKKILDLMSFIQAYYGIQFVGWWQKFSVKLPKEEKIDLNMWAWDWLPMYFSDFHFRIDEHFTLSILLVSDSGFFDKNEIKFDNLNKLNLNKFEPAENSKTKLIFIIEKDIINTERLLLGKGNEHWWHSKELFENEEGEKGNAIFKTYDLECFYNQENTEKLLDELSEFAMEKGYALKKLDL